MASRKEEGTIEQDGEARQFCERGLESHARFCSHRRGPKAVLDCVWDHREHRNVLDQNCGGSPRRPDVELAGAELACCPCPPPWVQTASLLPPPVLPRPEHHHLLALTCPLEEGKCLTQRQHLRLVLSSRSLGLSLPSPNPCPSECLHPPHTRSGTPAKNLFRTRYLRCFLQDLALRHTDTGFLWLHGLNCSRALGILVP